MTRNLIAVLVGVFVVLAVAAATLWGIARFKAGRTSGGVGLEVASEMLTEPGEAILYFPGRGGRLYPERRTLDAELAGEERLRLIVEQLLVGPESETLSPALPGEIELSDVTLGADGTLYLDLSSKQGTLRGMGSTSELLAIYSLVDTVLLNEPQAQSVILLWNGRQQPSLAGHIDTTRPLALNRRLIAESS